MKEVIRLPSPRESEPDPVRLQADSITRYALESYHGFPFLAEGYRQIAQVVKEQIGMYELNNWDLPDHLQAWNIHLKEFDDYGRER